MTKIYINSLLVLGIAALSGCNAIQAVNRAQAFDETRSEVQALPATGTMPTSGSATYRGDTALGADFGNDNYVLLGDTTLNAKFTGVGGTISGDMTNFTSIKLTDKEVDAYNNGTANVLGLALGARDLDGSVRISKGVITGNTFVAQTNGTLDGRSGTFDVSGDMNGTFKGADAAALEAGDSPTFTIKRDGVTANVSDMELYATQ